MATSSSTPGPVVLIIRDGWGENPDPGQNQCNAVHLASTPADDAMRRQWPWTLIRTCGEDVGLPEGVMGNSEVGHQNIGAGRIVDQEVMRITRAIRSGAFFENDALAGAFEHARRSGGRLHLLGLVSDGKVHSDIEHLLALMEMAERRDFPGDRLFLHAITDGRDTGPFTGRRFVKRIEQRMRETGRGRIATVTGRYWAMDRDNRWQRTALAYRALTGRGDCQLDEQVQTAASADEAIDHYYEHATEPSRSGDEFIVPTQIEDTPRIEEGDAVIFFNFRGDRPRQLTKAFVLDEHAWSQVPRGGFDRGGRLEDLSFCTMTAYEQGLPVTAVAMEKPPKLPGILGQVVSDAGRTQFRCAETEKYPHVTFFFNDYREEPFDGERRKLVDSPTEVSTYDQKPQMSAEGVCEAVLERLGADDCEALIVVNFANPDMVGHTGRLEAVIEAVEITDACVGRIVEKTLEVGGSLIVTADHGNAEQMWDFEHDCPHTAHTTNDVALFAIGEPFKGQELHEGGRLADIAPTLLAMMGLEQPEAMTGRALVQVATSAR